MEESNKQTQLEPGQEPELPRGLAGVAEILRRNESTLDLDPNDPQPPGEEPAAGVEDDQVDVVDAEPGLSEDGLGMQPAAAGGGDPDEPIALALQELAEKAGVSLKELYATVVPLGGELHEATTLGALKDQFKDYSTLVETRDAFEEGRTLFENDMIRTRGELQELVKMLPEIPPAMVQKAAQAFADSRDQEREALHRIKPEWKDADTYARAQDAILETVSEYGFKRGDLESVFDHRLTKLLWDFHVMRERFSNANAGAKKVVTVGKQRRTRGHQQAPKVALKKQLAEARDSHSTETKTKAVSALLAALK